MMPETSQSQPLKQVSLTPRDIPATGDPAVPWEFALAEVAPWLAPFWIAGVIVFYLRHAAGLVVLFRLRRRGVCSASERWQTELTRLGDQIRLSKPVLLLESCSRKRRSCLAISDL